MVISPKKRARFVRDVGNYGLVEAKVQRAQVEAAAVGNAWA